MKLAFAIFLLVALVAPTPVFGGMSGSPTKEVPSGEFEINASKIYSTVTTCPANYDPASGFFRCGDYAANRLGKGAFKFDLLIVKSDGKVKPVPQTVPELEDEAKKISKKYGEIEAIVVLKAAIKRDFKARLNGDEATVTQKSEEFNKWFDANLGADDFSNGHLMNLYTRYRQLLSLLPTHYPDMFRKDVTVSTEAPLGEGFTTQLTERLGDASIFVAPKDSCDANQFVRVEADESEMARKDLKMYLSAGCCGWAWAKKEPADDESTDFGKAERMRRIVINAFSQNVGNKPGLEKALCSDVGDVKESDRLAIDELEDDIASSSAGEGFELFKEQQIAAVHGVCGDRATKRDELMATFKKSSKAVQILLANSFLIGASQQWAELASTDAVAAASKGFGGIVNSLTSFASHSLVPPPSPAESDAPIKKVPSGPLETADEMASEMDPMGKLSDELRHAMAVLKDDGSMPHLPPEEEIAKGINKAKEAAEAAAKKAGVSMPKLPSQEEIREDVHAVETAAKESGAKQMCYVNKQCGTGDVCMMGFCVRMPDTGKKPDQKSYFYSVDVRSDMFKQELGRLLDQLNAKAEASGDAGSLPPKADQEITGAEDLHMTTAHLGFADQHGIDNFIANARKLAEVRPFDLKVDRFEVSLTKDKQWARTIRTVFKIDGPEDDKGENAFQQVRRVLLTMIGQDGDLDGSSVRVSKSGHVTTIRFPDKTVTAAQAENLAHQMNMMLAKSELKNVEIPVGKFELMQSVNRNGVKTYETVNGADLTPAEDMPTGLVDTAKVRLKHSERVANPKDLPNMPGWFSTRIYGMKVRASLPVSKDISPKITTMDGEVLFEAGRQGRIETIDYIFFDEGESSSSHLAVKGATLIPGLNDPLWQSNRLRKAPSVKNFDNVKVGLPNELEASDHIPVTGEYSLSNGDENVSAVSIKLTQYNILANRCTNIAYFQHATEYLPDHYQLTPAEAGAPGIPKHIVQRSQAEVSTKEKLFPAIRMWAADPKLPVLPRSFIKVAKGIRLDFNKRKNKLIRSMTAEDPDILTLEEVDMYQEFWKGELRKLGYDCARAEREMEHFFGPDVDGNCICYKTSKLRKVEEHPVVYVDDSYNRAGLVVILEAVDNGARLVVANTHLGYDGISEEGRAAQKNEITQLMDKIKEVNTDRVPVLMAGDLNSVPDSDVVKLIMSKGYEDTYYHQYQAWPPATSAYPTSVFSYATFPAIQHEFKANPNPFRLNLPDMKIEKLPEHLRGSKEVEPSSHNAINKRVRDPLSEHKADELASGIVKSPSIKTMGDDVAAAIPVTNGAATEDGA